LPSTLLGGVACASVPESPLDQEAVITWPAPGLRKSGATIQGSG